MAHYDEKKEWENNLVTIRVNDMYMTVKEVCLESKIPATMYHNLQNGMESPLYLVGKREGTVKGWVSRVLKTLDCTFAEAFPRYVCDLNKSKLTDDQCADFLMSNYSLNGNKENIVNKDFVSYIMKSLTKKQKTAIYLIFFEECTLEEAGKYMNITRERVRQIKAKALRNLRKAADYKSINHGYS